MSKTIGLMAAACAASLPAGTAWAAVLGPYAASCEEGRPAMLVKVEGLKARTGSLRVQSYGGDPRTFFAKGAYLTRVDLRVPSAGPVEVCLPVSRTGVYAVSVRHDVNGSGKSDMSDGGGFSGNPHLSLFDAIFKRKPDPAEVSVRVAGTTLVPVLLNYVQGGALRPVAMAEH